MTKSLNEVKLIGNVGGVPEIKTFGANRKLALVNIATTRSYKDAQGAWQEKTDWHRVKVWGHLAETVEKYVKKGDRLYFQAHLEYSTTGEGNEKKYFTDLVAEEMIMLSGKPSETRAGNTNSKSQPAPALATAEEESDDLPF